MKYYGLRFTSPVKPGDGIEVSAWEVGQGPEGTSEIVFEAKNLNTGKVSNIKSDHTTVLKVIMIKVVLGNGMAYIRKAEKSKL